MPIQRALVDMRWLVLSDYQLNILQYKGDMSGPTMTNRLRSFFTAYPHAASYSSLNDLREFTGSIGYEDMLSMAAMVRKFRNPDVKRKSILLTRDRAAVYIARLAQDIFQTTIDIYPEVEAAFAAAANGEPLPYQARRFLDGY